MDTPEAEPAALLSCIEMLEALVDDRGLLASVNQELRTRLLTAAGQVSRPTRDEQRHLARTRRKKRKADRRRAEDAALSKTGIRSLRSVPVFAAPPPALEAECGKEAPATTPDERKCYVCKTAFVELHHFYDQLCPPCAELNYKKRHQTADLSGRVALVTGGRVKIGFQAALKLLRAGAHVIVTTRFPNDAATRFADESDFSDFADRLEVHGLDLRHTPSVEQLCHYLSDTLPRLDIILNNACQTVRRPSGFYAHLLQAERDTALPLPAQAAVAAHRRHLGQRMSAVSTSAPALSQVPLLPEDVGRDLQLFPLGELDADAQQVDTRHVNSWRLRLHEVPTVELLEVQLVNAVAPFVLNGQLRELMRRTEGSDKHIVNVSAMEGQFYRTWKTDKHPHTNMAKAALNMMTRTSAADFLQDGIHMNSVDTGWVTDEDPIAIAARKVAEHRFHPPLDIVDGAARIVDPVFLTALGEPCPHGQFLKDYRPVAW